MSTNRSKKGKLPSGGPPKRAQPGGPPKRAQPSINKAQQNQDVIKRLQDLVKKKDKIIQGLNEQIKTLQKHNSDLEKKLKSGPKASKTNKSAGVASGPSQKNAAANLAGLLGGHVKNKKKAEDKVNGKKGGVSGGMSQKNAAAALGGLFAKKKAPPKANKGGVSGGMSQSGAAAALGGLFAKKKAPPKKAAGGGGGGGGGGADQYKQLFKKYEMMMKLGINVHGAVGRMRQDGCDKAAIKAFEKKHGGDQDFAEEEAPSKYGLKPKPEVSVSSGIKMKRLHWDTVAIKYVKGSIWEKLEDNSTIRYDKKHFELHFQVRQRKPIDEQKDGSKAKIEAGKILTFVSKKRTQACLIGLKNLNLSNDQLRKVLHDMDETVMDVDTLSKLLDMAPSMDEQTEAEKKIMQEGTRRPKDYGTVEQFFFTLCDFYNLDQRLKLWMFKQNFYEICDSLLDQYKTIGKACDKMSNNKNLRLLLTIILTFGNHMNSGTRKGQQYGFDLKILTGMTGVKSFDNTRSLLMYIYEFCDRKYPSAIRVLPELSTILKSAASMEVETLKQAYKRIQDNMCAIKNLITSDEIENYDIDDRFIMELTKFHKKAAPKMKKFNMTVGNVMVSTKRVMKKFTHGNEDNPQTVESFFKIWWQFLQDFSGAKEKLILLEKERQKRIAKRKKAKNKEMQKKMHQKYGAGGAGQQQSQHQEMQKGGSLHREFQKRQQFEKKKNGLHGKLRGHVKQRSIFVANGGKVDKSQPQTDTMRRLSSMYQNQQQQVKALEDARKKAAILKYNKFKLPEMNQQMKRKWTATSFADNFEIPDDKQMMKPKPNQRNPGMPNTGMKPGSPPSNMGMKSPNPIGKKPLKIAPKQKQHNKGNQHVPPPPHGHKPNIMNNNAPYGQKGGAQNQNGAGAYPMYGQNPANNWQQQQQSQLGYGSNPNLSYQQAQQYQPHNNQYQQQQRQQFGQQPKSYYNSPPAYKR